MPSACGSFHETLRHRSRATAFRPWSNRTSTGRDLGPQTLSHELEDGLHLFARHVCSMTSSMLRSSRFSMTVATGNRVPLNTHAPPTLSGTLSTAGQFDQSSAAMDRSPSLQLTGSRRVRHAGSCCASKALDPSQPAHQMVPL